MKSIEDMIAEAILAIKAVFLGKHPVVIAFSGGKDSSVVANLVLLAAKEVTLEGESPMVVVMTGSTMVENPEVDIHFRVELAKMKEYGDKHGFEVSTHIIQPNILSTWQVQVLTGRSLPSFAGTQAACSVELKVKPQGVYRRKLFRELGSQCKAAPVICLGTRREESAQRAARMDERGESALKSVLNKDGELVLSPIADWTTDDVWEAIGLASNGMTDSFSDFEECKRIYAHSESTSCAVVADAISTGKKKGGCGARTGCFVCTQSSDKSLENMINYDPRYAYAKGLVKFNKFLVATRYDWSRRNLIGRSINAGFLRLQPDTYHPKMVRELFRYMLQLDYDEACRAEAEGVAPMFRMMPIEMIIAIDAMWSLKGMAMPFAAWADYDNINSGRVRYDIPEIEAFKNTPLPEPKYLYVGDVRTETNDFDGLRDAFFEAVTEMSSCGVDLVTTDDGRVVWDIDSNKIFSVDSESAQLIATFELDSMLAKYNAGFAVGGVTAAYKWYVQYGVLNVFRPLEHDETLRHTALKDRLGLSYEYDPDELMAKAVGFDEMPEEARAVWSKKPATEADSKVISIKEVSYVPDPEMGWFQQEIFESIAA